MAPEQPASQAGRTALAARLARVLHFLPLAAKKAGEDVEYVHQLRVSTRRAAATQEAFAEFLPRRRGKRLCRRLRHIRRAAGAARDCDVMISRFEGLAAQSKAVAAMLKKLKRQRSEAQTPIAEIHRRMEKKRFAREVQEVVSRVCWREDNAAEPDFAALGRRRLEKTLSAFWSASMNIDAHSADNEPLHAFRIQGKALRYSIEIFSAALPGGLRSEIYPQIEQLQDLLGGVNDCATAVARFEHWAEEAGKESYTECFQRLAEEEADALEENRREFFAWWTPDRGELLRRQFESVFTVSPACEG